MDPRVLALTHPNDLLHLQPIHLALLQRTGWTAVSKSSRWFRSSSAHSGAVMTRPAQDGVEAQTLRVYQTANRWTLSCLHQGHWLHVVDMPKTRRSKMRLVQDVFDDLGCVYNTDRLDTAIAALDAVASFLIAQDISGIVSVYFSKGAVYTPVQHPAPLDHPVTLGSGAHKGDVAAKPVALDLPDALIQQLRQVPAIVLPDHTRPYCLASGPVHISLPTSSHARSALLRWGEPVASTPSS